MKVEDLNIETFCVKYSQLQDSECAGLLTYPIARKFPYRSVTINSTVVEPTTSPNMEEALVSAARRSCNAGSNNTVSFVAAF